MIVPLRRSRTNGFTLLELLIAMALLGFILALLYGGMRLGARSWDAGELRSGQNTHLSLMQNFMRRQLTQIYPFQWKKKADTGLAFTGEQNRLMFVAPMAARLGPGGLFLMSLELIPGQEGGQLIMKRAIPEPESVDFKAALESDEKIVLAEQVDTLEFAYFGAETKDAEPQWQDKWELKDNQARLPYLIRLRLKFSNGRAWPDLVVAPAIGQYTGCVWDNTLNRCVSGS